jgi:prepilin peptidase CpaA
VATYPLIFVFPFVMAFAAAMDLLTMRIANSVSLGLAATFAVVAFVAGMPMQVMLMHLGVGVAALVVGMVLFSLRLVGGGDAKLFAGAALWIGFDHFVPFFAYVTIFGGALALLLLAYRKTPADFFPLPTWAARLHNVREGMPYGVAIAAGALTVYPLTSWPALLAG